MRPRRQLGEKEQEALKAAIRESFEEQEQKRDDEFEEHANRLLKSIDEFEKGADGERPAD